MHEALCSVLQRVAARYSASVHQTRCASSMFKLRDSRDGGFVNHTEIVNRTEFVRHLDAEFISHKGEGEALYCDLWYSVLWGGYD